MLPDSLTQENGKLKTLPLHTMSEDMKTREMRFDLVNMNTFFTMLTNNKREKEND